MSIIIRVALQADFAIQLLLEISAPLAIDGFDFCGHCGKIFW
jgi:hypothetical protein